ncbi:MAG: SoxR reducing system RseC family protein [Gammaproteobacteria bacterium]
MLLDREGRVERVDGRVAVVRVRLPEGCARCARGQGCGFGLATRTGERRLILDLPAAVDVSVGERVRVGLEQADLTRASVAVYGIPLLGLLGGAAAAGTLGLGDAPAIGLTIATLGAGLIVARGIATGLARRDGCRPRLLGPIDRGSPDA